MSTTIEWYWYEGITGGRGVSRVSDVRACTNSPRNATTYHGDGTITVNFYHGGTTVYHPATEEEVKEIMTENAAYIQATADLGEKIISGLRTAGLPMARWGHLGGDGVFVHIGGSHVAVFWWHSTEHNREVNATVWQDTYREPVREVLAKIGEVQEEKDGGLFMSLPHTRKES